jgi:hypothetical protein
MRKLIYPILVMLCVGCSDPKGMPYTLEFHDKGVGNLSGMSPFEEAMISASLLGFSVEKYTRVQGAQSEPVFLVKRGAQSVLEIYPTKDRKFIDRIESDSLHVKAGAIKRESVIIKDERCFALEDETLQCALSDHVALVCKEDNASQWIVKRVIWMRNE